jgi:hypothetical protein
VTKDTITFDDGNRAVAITTARDENAKAILDALGIPSPSAVILLFGGAGGLDDSRKAHFAALLPMEAHNPASEHCGLDATSGDERGPVVSSKA